MPGITTLQEFIDEFLQLVLELPDDPDETIMITGFLNEQMAMNDFTAPLEEMMVVLKHVRPAIASYIDLTANREFKKLFKSELTLEQALERLGVPPDYFAS